MNKPLPQTAVSELCATCGHTNSHNLSYGCSYGKDWDGEGHPTVCGCKSRLRISNFPPEAAQDSPEGSEPSARPYFNDPYCPEATQEVITGILPPVSVTTPEDFQKAKKHPKWEYSKAPHANIILDLVIREREILDALHRATEAEEKLAAMTSDRDLWQEAHNEDCPNAAKLAELEALVSKLTTPLTDDKPHIIVDQLLDSIGLRGQPVHQTAIDQVTPLLLLIPALRKTVADLSASEKKWREIAEGR